MIRRVVCGWPHYEEGLADWQSAIRQIDNLQVNTNDLGTVNWGNVVAAPLDNGTTKAVIVNPPTGNRFYRLFKP